MSTKLRKAKENLNHLEIVNDYAKGELSVAEVAMKHQTSVENVGIITKRFWKSLTNMREARALKSPATEHFTTKAALHELEHTELINESFLELLSDPSSALLTHEESQYAWVYVHTGDCREALKVSGLDAGLYREKKKDSRFSYDKALILRSAYLNSRPNIVQYIKELRETRLIDADVGKARVQSELIDQIEQMKASGDGKQRTALLRAIELLGKTVGAYVDRVEVREVNPADALDQLIEVAKEAQVTEVSEDVKEIVQ